MSQTKTPTVDKYDVAIAYLTQHPGEMPKAWTNPKDHPAGALFNIIPGIGLCLTMIRWREGRWSFTGTAAEIARDSRIPLGPGQLRLSHLPVFAEWQRRLDRESGR